MYQSIELSKRRTDHRFPVHRLRNLPGREDLFPMLYDLPHVAGWEQYNVHELAHIA